MKGQRLIIALVCFAAAGVAFYLFSSSTPKVTVSNAILQPMGSSYALTFTISNPGGPDQLINVAPEGKGHAMMHGAPYSIPAGSTPSLAMDGAHAMIMGVGDLTDGRLIPFRLDFDRSGVIIVRARVNANGDSGMAMDHSATYDVPEGETPPIISLNVSQDGDGWLVQADTTNFTFSQEAVDGPHSPNEGHAHLYLNGLKLQRMYDTQARIGALPRGPHSLQVTLNTNDHRSYAVGKVPVSATVQIVSD